MIRIHSSFHKCLTMLYIRVMDTLYNRFRPFSPQYKHYESIQGLFYNNLDKYKIISVNGFAVDIGRLGEDFRIVRFVRDPRDLIVSGYFYHLRGAEPWFRMHSPTRQYWNAINGNIPDGISPGESYSDYLQSLGIEDGLIAEIQFRKHHLESLRHWSINEKIKVFKYETIIGREAETFREIFDFYQLSKLEKAAGAWLADRFSMKNRQEDRHLRDPRPGQWQQHFTQRVQTYFDDRYADLILKLDY